MSRYEKGSHVCFDLKMEGEIFDLGTDRIFIFYTFRVLKESSEQISLFFQTSQMK